MLSRQARKFVPLWLTTGAAVIALSGCSSGSGYGAMTPEEKADRDVSGMSKIGDSCNMSFMEVVAAQNNIEDLAKSQGKSLSSSSFISQSLDAIEKGNYMCDYLRKQAQ